MTNRAIKRNAVDALADDFEHVHTNGNGANGHDHGSSSSEESTTKTPTQPLPQRGKMDRKKSSPMAPNFMVSAPGKVIVFGEHAVVHGKVSPLRNPLLLIFHGIRYSPPLSDDALF